MVIFEEHDCLLHVQEEDIVKQFVDTGLFISVRRKCRKMCMISRHHPLTSGFFQSHASCRNEEIRNLVHYYCTIHPFSMFDLHWQFFMFLVFAAQFLVIPIDALYQIKSHNRHLIKIIKFALDMVQLADIIKIFYTGYYNEQNSKVVLKRSTISKRYLTTYFFFDAISSLYSYMYPSVLWVEMWKPDLISQNVLLAIRLLNRLKIVRISRWLNILELFRQYMGYSCYLFKGIRVVLIFIVITLWAFSITFFIENYGSVSRQTEDLTYICSSYFNATVMLLVVSYGAPIDEVNQYASTVFFLCFGFGLQMFLYTQILQVWTKYANAQNKHHSLHKQFKEYMKYKVLPVSLRERIFSYFEFKFHRQFFKENDINNIISPILKQEILLHVTRDHIEKVDIFKELPEHILMKVVAHLKSEIFLPGDVIVSAGTPGNCMFFIYHGTVAVFTPQGKELCHLEDGSHFGEIALIFSETRVATVVAVTPCELFMLRRTDFLETIEPFPEVKEQLISLATERLHRTILESENDLQDNQPPTNNS